MEKRHKKTLARTLRNSAVCARLVLVGGLFVPALLVQVYFPQIANDSIAVREPQKLKPKPKELVKIYSIVKSHRPDVSDNEAWRVADVILEQSSKHSFDPMLVLAMIQVESGFQYAVVSPSGARGIMQILPDVAKAVLEEISPVAAGERRHFKPESLDDPILNIKLGVSYLHTLKRSFQNLKIALSAYNLGPTETRNRLDNDIELSDDYSSAVLAAYNSYKNVKHPLF
jgi:soluble lytic murein transglycosylase-like protein